MAALLWREDLLCGEVLHRDRVWVAHDLFRVGFEAAVQELVDILVAEVLVHDAVDEHEVLDDGVSHGQRRFHLLTPALAVGHLECKLALSIHAVRTGLAVLMQYREGVIFPVETCQRVVGILCFVEILVPEREQVGPMNAELVLLVFRSHRACSIV